MTKRIALFIMLSAIFQSVLHAQIQYPTASKPMDRLVLRSSGQFGKMMYTSHSDPEYPGFGFSYSGEVSVGLQTDGSKLWHSVYGYPEFAFSFWLSTLGNQDIYGNLYGLLPEMTFVLKENRNNRFKMRLGLGFAYFNNPHDFETNRMNVIIGSEITNLSLAGFYWEKQVNSQLAFQTGLNLIHCSNGHYTLPNLGLNLPLIFGAVSYRPDGKIKTHLPDNGLPEPVAGGKVHLRAGYGKHELGRATTITAEKKYDVYTATLTYSRFFWKGGRYHVGFTGKYYQDWYEKIRELDYYEEQIKLKSSAFTFILGHEFLFNRWSLYTHGGLNLYNPFYEQYTKLNYKGMNIHRYIKKYISGKLGVQYYVKSPYTHKGLNAYLGLFIKSNFTQADFVELAMGLLL